MQGAWMTPKHGENSRYWRVVRLVWRNYKSLKTCNLVWIFGSFFNNVNGSIITYQTTSSIDISGSRSIIFLKKSNYFFTVVFLGYVHDGSLYIIIMKPTQRITSHNDHMKQSICNQNPHQWYRYTIKQGCYHSIVFYGKSFVVLAGVLQNLASSPTECLCACEFEDGESMVTDM